MKPGQKASHGKTIAEYDLFRFTEISGDSNPLHVELCETRAFRGPGEGSSCGPFLRRGIQT
jgi:acyl dehydratase